MAEKRKKPVVKEVFSLAGSAFLVMVGLSILFPILPYFIRSLSLSESDGGILVGTYAFLSFLSAPLWGKIVDRYGPKRVLVFALLGWSFGFLWFGLGNRFLELLLARAVTGFFAGGILPTIFSIIPSFVERERRASAFGILGAGIGLGILLGPALGGVIGETMGVRFPFLCTSFLGLGNLLYVSFYFPERKSLVSLPPSSSRTPFLSRYLPYLVVGVLLSIVQTGFESVVGFLITDRFQKGPLLVGVFLGTLGFVSVLIQGVGVGFLSRFFSRRVFFQGGSLLLSAGLLGMGFTQTLPFFFLSGILFAVGGSLVQPSFLALFSEQGEDSPGFSQGLYQSAQSFGRIIGPPFATFLYEYLGRSTPFAFLSGFLLLPLVYSFIKGNRFFSSPERR
jgi:predicted MFS family arabinose efflux permease